MYQAFRIGVFAHDDRDVDIAGEAGFRSDRNSEPADEGAVASQAREIADDPSKGFFESVHDVATTRRTGRPSGEAPSCPVFVDGRKFTTLKGTPDELAEAFRKLVDDYVETKYPRREGR